MELVMVMPIYNEFKSGNLDKLLNNIVKIGFNKVIILDDGSTDNSYNQASIRSDIPVEIYRNENNSLLSSGQSRWYFLNKKAQEEKADWVYIASCDVIMSQQGLNGRLREYVEFINDHFPDVTRLSIKEPQLWRSQTWYRTDKKWEYWTNNGELRLFKCAGIDLDKYMNKQAMLHRSHHCPSIPGKIAILPEIVNIHHAFDTKEKIIEKFRNYMERSKYNKHHDPVFSPRPEDCFGPSRVWQQNSFKILEEFELKLEQCDPSWWPEEGRLDFSESKPNAVSWDEVIGQYCGLDKQKEYKDHFIKTYGYYKSYKDV